MAIKTASKEGTFCTVILLIVAMADARDTERVVAWQHPVASNVALDMLHRVMLLALLQRLRVTIKMTCDGGTFACLRQYVAKGMVQAWVAQKTLKRDILRVFIMSDFINIYGDNG